MLSFLQQRCCQYTADLGYQLQKATINLWEGGCFFVFYFSRDPILTERARSQRSLRRHRFAVYQTILTGLSVIFPHKRHLQFAGSRMIHSYGARPTACFLRQHQIQYSIYGHEYQYINTLIHYQPIYKSFFKCIDQYLWPSAFKFLHSDIPELESHLTDAFRIQK